MLRLKQFLEDRDAALNKRDPLVRMRHEVMCAYGWISDDEWKRLPSRTILSLYEEIQKDNKKIEAQFRGNNAR